MGDEVRDILGELDGIAATELGLSIGGLLLAVFFVHLVVSRVLLKWILRFAEKSIVKWDDLLVQEKVFHRLVPFPGLLVLQLGLPFVPHVPVAVVEITTTAVLCLLAFFGARSISALLSTGNEIYRNYAKSGVERPIKGYVQVVQVVTYIVAGLLIVSFLVGKSPLILLSGLGAMTAVLLLVFRDSILSLVAGIQLTQNDLIRVGDWIEMPQFNADGDVVEIALNVVTVQNWDRTTTVIPTHKFLEHSFRNWRGMFDGGGRRVKRALNLDMSTIRFLTDEEIQRLRSIVILREYIDEKLKEIEDHNAREVPPEYAGQVANFRKLTNVGTLRAYITAYVRNHPKVNQELIILIRQMESTPKGLPLEVYLFTSETGWVAYEGIQADLFDHLFAVLPEFGLRVFQEPSGADWSRVGQGLLEGRRDEVRRMRRDESAPVG